MLNKFLLWATLIVPWFSMFFMKKASIKRYMPAAIFVSLLLAVVYENAYTYKWWVTKVTIFPFGHIMNPSYVFGPFIVGTIWILYFTFRKFWVYLITNIVVDCIFAFGVLPITKWLGIDELLKISNFGALLIMLALALAVYGYQRWQEGVLKDIGSTGGSTYPADFGSKGRNNGDGRVR